MGDGWRWLPVERASSGDTGAAGHARLARLLGMPDGCQAAGTFLNLVQLLTFPGHLLLTVAADQMAAAVG